MWRAAGRGGILRKLKLERSVSFLWHPFDHACSCADGVTKTEPIAWSPLRGRTGSQPTTSAKRSHIWPLIRCHACGGPDLGRANGSLTPLQCTPAMLRTFEY